MQNKDAVSTRKGASTRDRIVAAARHKLIEQGIEAFGLRELADSLGLTLSNVQYYFKTRENLLLFIFEQEAARDVAVINAHQHSFERAEDAFCAIIRDLVTRWRGDSGVLFSTLGTLALHNKTFRKLYRFTYTNFYAALEGPICQMNPELPKDEVKLRVRLVTALIDGSPLQTQVGKDFLQRLQAQAELIAKA